MTVLVVDYGVGNLHSVSCALENIGCSVQVSSDPRAIESSERIILPGVGSFSAAMAKLRERGWIEPLIRAVTEEHLPFLGICLGMQLLAEHGREGADVAGLGLIPADVVRLEPMLAGERIPHVGWNDVTILREDDILAGVEQGADFYFVHSYRMRLSDDNHCVARANYCGGFPAVIRDGNVIGVQFHPEKSAKVGMRLLHNFVHGL